MVDAKQPIFIHSLFRAGSTFLFECFRRSSAGYTTYQEPLNEHLLNARQHPERLLEVHESMSAYLRHPKLEKPYFAEFHPLAESIGSVFTKSLCYDEYFLDEIAQPTALKEYFQVLIEGAPVRAVLQECRSTGRTDWLRNAFGGVHLFLRRNPRDQWWSYQVDSYFSRANLLILNGPHVPPVFAALRDRWGIPAHHEHDLSAEIHHVERVFLTAHQSYTLFFALWLHAMVVSRPLCDVDISIDELSTSEAYRAQIDQQLKSLRISGIDFSDSAIPQASYSVAELDEFRSMEGEVYAEFVAHGYSKGALDAAMVELVPRGSFGPSSMEGPRLRSLVLREREFVTQRSLELRRLEEDFRRVQQALDDEKQLGHQQQILIGSLNRLADEQKRLTEEWKQIAEDRQKMVDSMISSTSWRLTSPLRRLASLFGRT